MYGLHLLIYNFCSPGQNPFAIPAQTDNRGKNDDRQIAASSQRGNSQEAGKCESRNGLSVGGFRGKSRPEGFENRWNMS